MISSRKRQLLIALFLACICVPVFGAESGEVKAGLKFETADKEQQWVIDVNEQSGQKFETRKEMVRSSFRPKYVAVFYVERGHSDMPPYYKPREGPNKFSWPMWIESILSSAAGKSLSEHQADLLHTGACIRLLGKFGDTIGNHQHVRIYAVSEKDARKTVEAFMEALAMPRPSGEYLGLGPDKLRERISKAEKELSEKQAELKSTQTHIAELKKSVHYVSRDEAKQIAMESNKTLITIDVEIAGLQAKISTIEKYISDKKISADTQAKLEAMLSEQHIELAGALAKKEAATKVRDHAAEYCDVSYREIVLLDDVHHLKETIRLSKQNLESVEKMLNTREPAPNVFQNKVIIYPVGV
ncbi:MAG: hypothetical protein ACYTEO_16085 [Planctomycetota bacterium]|jgi:hypothetical protein